LCNGWHTLESIQLQDPLRACNFWLFHHHQNGTDMTSTKRPLKVFLCHAHSHKDAVEALDAGFNKSMNNYSAAVSRPTRLTTPTLRVGAGENG
jgi:hypothetical protein